MIVIEIESQLHLVIKNNLKLIIQLVLQ